MTAQPTHLALDDDKALRISWSDGVVRRYRPQALREACPCATCREKRDVPASPFAILSPAETRPLAILAMRPVGNYAYSVEFSDGHDTGIYTIELLRELGEDVSPRG